MEGELQIEPILYVGYNLDVLKGLVEPNSANSFCVNAKKKHSSLCNELATKECFSLPIDSVILGNRFFFN